MVADVPARLGGKGEGADLAVFHSDPHLIAGRGMRPFFDFIAGISAAYRAGHRGKRATVSVADLIAQYPTQYRTGHHTDSARFSVMLNCPHRLDCAANPANWRGFTFVHG